MLSFSDFDGGHGLFLGLTRPEELLRGEPQKSNLDIFLDGSSLLLHRNCSEADNVRLCDGGIEPTRTHDNPTSSGSGHTLHVHKPGKGECPNAQKRFRARQKERMTCLEQEVAEKKATFEQLAQENLLLRARTNILEKVVSCRDEQLNLVQAFEERCRIGPGTQSFFGSSNFNTVADGDAAAQESFRMMKKEQVVPQYKAFLAEVSRDLLHCQYPCCDPTSPIVQKVTACVDRMRSVLKHLVLLNAPLMRQLLLLNMETGQPGTPTDGHWDGVVASLQLGAQQRADIMAVLDLYHGLLAKVYEERKLIRAGLGEGPGTLDPAASSFVARNELASEMELMERLNANLAKEHSAHTLLSCFFMGKVLVPAQFAKVAVYSYPFFPDCLAVASAVARLHHRNLGAGGGGGGSRAGGASGSGASGSGSRDSHHHKHR
ncbi:hypothetical protein PLESTF_000577500 [Pleodorina starrii]|nr:hypothetical protein PLESTF_000577500 [Pleodorina starrii]